MTISSGHASIHIREFPQTDNDSESSVFGLFDVDAYCCDFSYDFGPNRRSVFLCPLDSENSSQDEKHLSGQEGLMAPPSHTTGRADFPHPAVQPPACCLEKTENS